MTTLKFASKTIPGSTESLVYSSPEVPLRRVKYWDVIGEGEIAGRRGGRAIVVTHLFHDQFPSVTKLQIALDELDRQVGKHGRLQYTATVHGGDSHVETLNNCTLERYEKIPVPGQEAAMPLKDFAGTLFDDDGEADGGWFIYLMLYFRQLRT